MKLIKKITNPAKVKSFIPLIMIFFSMNNLIAYGSENKLGFPKNRNDQINLRKNFFIIL